MRGSAFSGRSLLPDAPARAGKRLSRPARPLRAAGGARAARQGRGAADDKIGCAKKGQ